MLHNALTQFSSLRSEQASVATLIVNEVMSLESFRPDKDKYELVIKKIDRLIYSLYELDLDEVYVVESSIYNVPKSRKNSLYGA